MPQRYPGLEFNNPLVNFVYKIYDFYAGFLELRDLPIIKRMGKKIAVTYQGSDARQGNFLRERFKLHNLDIPLPETVSDASDRCKEERINKFNQYADLIYSLNPDLFYVLPERTKFLPYATIDLNKWQYIEPFSSEKSRPLVIHAPTHRGIKGTNSIVSASLALVEQFADNGTAISNQVRSNLDSELSKLPTNILSEYFSKSDVGKTLLETSKELE